MYLRDNIVVWPHGRLFGHLENAIKELFFFVTSKSYLKKVCSLISRHQFLPRPRALREEDSRLRRILTWWRRRCKIVSAAPRQNCVCICLIVAFTSWCTANQETSVIRDIDWIVIWYRCIYKKKSNNQFCHLNTITFKSKRFIIPNRRQ